ncbi:MAG: hypothetical protein EOO88_21885 [Pedobacter sp.]|nr:MAG: hypothetical protein EOO88_21885 [Pedobacter sp.]
MFWSYQNGLPGYPDPICFTLFSTSKDSIVQQMAWRLNLFFASKIMVRKAYNFGCKGKLPWALNNPKTGLYSPISFLFMTTSYDQRIFHLAQLWKIGNMNEEEFEELNAWYQTLEDAPLEPPDGVTVERVEQRLHEQLKKYYLPQYPNVRFPWEKL